MLIENKFQRVLVSYGNHVRILTFKCFNNVDKVDYTNFFECISLGNFVDSAKREIFSVAFEIVLSLKVENMKSCSSLKLFDVPCLMMHYCNGLQTMYSWKGKLDKSYSFVFPVSSSVPLPFGDVHTVLNFEDCEIATKAAFEASNRQLPCILTMTWNDAMQLGICTDADNKIRFIKYRTESKATIKDPLSSDIPIAEKGNFIASESFVPIVATGGKFGKCVRVDSIRTYIGKVCKWICVGLFTDGSIGYDENQNIDCLYLAVFSIQVNTESDEITFVPHHSVRFATMKLIFRNLAFDVQLEICAGVSSTVTFLCCCGGLNLYIYDFNLSSMIFQSEHMESLALSCEIRNAKLFSYSLPDQENSIMCQVNVMKRCRLFLKPLFGRILFVPSIYFASELPDTQMVFKNRELLISSELINNFVQNMPSDLEIRFCASSACPSLIMGITTLMTKIEVNIINTSLEYSMPLQPLIQWDTSILYVLKLKLVIGTENFGMQDRVVLNVVDNQLSLYRSKSLLPNFLDSLKTQHSKMKSEVKPFDSVLISGTFVRDCKCLMKDLLLCGNCVYTFGVFDTIAFSGQFGRSFAIFSNINWIDIQIHSGFHINDFYGRNINKWESFNKFVNFLDLKGGVDTFQVLADSFNFGSTNSSIRICDGLIDEVDLSDHRRIVQLFVFKMRIGLLIHQSGSKKSQLQLEMWDISDVYQPIKIFILPKSLLAEVLKPGVRVICDFVSINDGIEGIYCVNIGPYLVAWALGNNYGVPNVNEIVEIKKSNPGNSVDQISSLLLENSSSSGWFGFVADYLPSSLFGNSNAEGVPVAVKDNNIQAGSLLEDHPSDANSSDRIPLSVECFCFFSADLTRIFPHLELRKIISLNVLFDAKKLSNHSYINVNSSAFVFVTWDGVLFSCQPDHLQGEKITNGSNLLRLSGLRLLDYSLLVGGDSIALRSCPCYWNIRMLSVKSCGVFVLSEDVHSCNNGIGEWLMRLITIIWYKEELLKPCKKFVAQRINQHFDFMIQCVEYVFSEISQLDTEMWKSFVELMLCLVISEDDLKRLFDFQSGDSFPGTFAQFQPGLNVFMNSLTKSLRKLEPDKRVQLFPLTVKSTYAFQVNVLQLFEFSLHCREGEFASRLLTIVCDSGDSMIRNYANEIGCLYLLDDTSENTIFTVFSLLVSQELVSSALLNLDLEVYLESAAFCLRFEEVSKSLIPVQSKSNKFEKLNLLSVHAITLNIFKLWLSRGLYWCTSTALLCTLKNTELRHILKDNIARKIFEAKSSFKSDCESSKSNLVCVDKLLNELQSALLEDKLSINCTITCEILRLMCLKELRNNESVNHVHRINPLEITIYLLTGIYDADNSPVLVEVDYREVSPRFGSNLLQIFRESSIELNLYSISMALCIACLLCDEFDNFCDLAEFISAKNPELPKLSDLYYFSEDVAVLKLKINEYTNALLNFM